MQYLVCEFLHKILSKPKHTSIQLNLLLRLYGCGDLGIVNLDHLTFYRKINARDTCIFLQYHLLTFQMPFLAFYLSII